MRSRPLRSVSLLLGLGLYLTAALAQAQSVGPSGDADGLLHAALTLATQEVSLAYPPDLSANDPEHQPLLSATVGSRIGVGTLEGHRALRIGSIAPALDPAVSGVGGEGQPSSSRYELELVRNAAGWELEARRVGDEEDVQRIPLVHRTTETSATLFTASLHATAAESGRLALRWGQHAWSTDFRFDELPRPTSRRVSGRGQARQPDTDTTAFSRGTTLAERDESALVLPDGSRIAVLYSQRVDVEDEDYRQLWTTADGAVVRLIRAAVLRLKTDVPLQFAEAIVPTGNLAPGFAGAYGVWLRRVGEGWRFVFNDEADSWGTQHDAAFDVVEIDADYARGDGAFRPLAVTVAATGTDRGRMIVHWGPHEWAADFVVAR